ncbi:MAG: hypothetical protein Q7R58_01115 [bacterium]|nr:hypothetical protein [bacterium]
MDTTHIPQTTLPGAEPPKKYIRTYAGDIEILKKGGKPDLKPLEPPETKTPTTTQAPPSAPTPPPIPIFHLTPPPPPTPLTTPTPLSAPEPEPEQKPPVISAPAPPPAPKPEPPKPSPIETYESDFSQRVKDTHASTATILAAEQDALSGPPRVTPTKSSRGNIFYVIAGAALLILGITGSYIAYAQYLAKTKPVILAPTLSAPIFVDEKEKITATSPQEILQAIEQSVTRQLTPNTVRLLYIDLATTTSSSVFSSLQLPAPGALLRNVNAEHSMAGVVNIDGAQSPLFILSVASYGDTFAGMLSWELRMPRDLSSLFPLYPQLPVSTTTAATPTSVSVVSFRDEVVGNHDVRIYRDSEGRSILLYGYWNQTTLVIARDPAAFIEILGRLATTRTKN